MRETTTQKTAAAGKSLKTLGDAAAAASAQTGKFNMQLAHLQYMTHLYSLPARDGGRVWMKPLNILVLEMLRRHYAHPR